MKLIIPVYDNKLIAEGFNKTTHVCIFDPETSDAETCCFIPWRTIIPPGSKITKQMKEMGIAAVLTSQIQLLALNLFVENGIQVYKSSGTDLTQNLLLYKQNKLHPFTVTDAMESSNLCSGTCDSCTSDESNCKE